MDDAEQGADERGEQHKKSRLPGAAKTAFCKGKHAFGLSRGSKVRAGSYPETDSGKCFVQLFHGNAKLTPGRIVDTGVSAPEPGQDDKMIEIPVENAGKLDVFPQTFRLAAEAFRRKTIVSGRPEHVFGIGPVAGDAAVAADLL